MVAFEDFLECLDQKGTDFIQSRQGADFLNDPANGPGLVMGPLKFQSLLLKPLGVVRNTANHVVKRGGQSPHFILAFHLNPDGEFSLIDFLRGLGQCRQRTSHLPDKEEGCEKHEQKD